MKKQQAAARETLRRSLLSSTEPVGRLLVGNSVVEEQLDDETVARVVERLVALHVLTPEQLAERALKGADVTADADAWAVTPLQAAAIYQRALDSLSPEVRRALVEAAAHPKGLGGLDPSDPAFLEARKLTPALTDEVLAAWRNDLSHRIFLPAGPTSAVDHRASLGPARDQAGRPTCTSFSSTAAMESLEFHRDRRPGPRDLSEELMWWYSKSGQLYTAGGYDCAAALRHYTEYGSCEETYFPYNGSEIPINHTQVPAPDEAMDRAHFFTSDAVVSLPVNGDAGDIAAAKAALSSGRCVSISSDTDNWDTGAGMIGFPDPLDSKGRGGAHCTTLIGYIDRDDLPAVCEGGYFVHRNSWGGAGSASNALGPEYGGHLLMPYGWYRRYISAAAAFVDADAGRAGRRWRAEYFANASLRGVPARVEEIGAVDEDWGTGSPFTFDFGPFRLDLGPDDLFSARFTQLRRFRPGWWRFKLRGDDGVRLWVDDRLVINAWHDQGATEYVQEHYLSGGDHVLRVEYYERTGQASLRLQVEPVAVHVDLYANDRLSGAPAAGFDDTATDFEWRHAPPVVNRTANGRFSLRATSTKHFTGGTYRFHAHHTGGCRIYLDGALVLDDWAGGTPNGSATTVSEGAHQVVVEFKHSDTVPAIGSHTYYRAALAFDWSDAAWQVSIHEDLDRQQVGNAGFPNPDSAYEAFRTDALTGRPVFEHQYPADNAAPGQYTAHDGVPLQLRFGAIEQFQTGIPGAPAGFPKDWLGAHIRRRIHIDDPGTYQFSFKADDGNRLIVDGKQIVESTYIVDDFCHADLQLGVGVHDIAIEYANTMWGGIVDFTMDRAAWAVEYYRGTNFESLVGTGTADSVDTILASAPATLGSSNLSVRARRAVFRPVGRFRVAVRADDGVRLKVAGVPVIDAWTDEGPTTYSSIVEHRGGDLAIEIEYYQRGGGELLEFSLVPAGFFGEYYRGVTLEKPAQGAALDRNVPIAYRYEEAIDFDWGRTGRLPRIGASLFSARWTGPVVLPSGRWKISLTSDDGVRLLLDGRMLIDNWHDESATESSAIVDLPGRSHALAIEYYQRRGDASCRLAFERLY